MLFIISRIGVIYCSRFQFNSIRAYRPRYDSDPLIVRSLFVTVSSNELDQCAIWDTIRLDAVHDTNGLASYLITCKFMTILMEHWLRTEDWRLFLSTLIVRYKCCGNVVVFSAFRYVALALALGAVALALALRVVALLTSLVHNTLISATCSTYYTSSVCELQLINIEPITLPT